MARTKRHAYTEEFRRKAVKRSEKEGNTTATGPSQLFSLSMRSIGKGKTIVELLSPAISTRVWR